jgi:hypothetical protein
MATITSPAARATTRSSAGFGNDVIQGDGTIGMFAGATPYQLGQAQLSLQLASGGTYTLPAGFTTFGAARGGPVPTDPSNFGFSANFSGALTVNPSFEGAGDGNDYVEGGGGNDVIFGSLGQMTLSAAAPISLGSRRGASVRTDPT